MSKMSHLAREKCDIFDSGKEENRKFYFFQQKLIAKGIEKNRRFSYNESIINDDFRKEKKL